MATEADQAARQRFLDQLHTDQAALADHQGFVSYWQSIEGQARDTEDIGQLDRWVKDLARDRDRLTELKNRKQAAASSQMGAQEAVQLIHRILALLDDLYIKLRRRLMALRDEAAHWVFLVGPGKKSKRKPDKDADKDKKSEQAKQALADKTKKKPVVKKTKA